MHYTFVIPPINSFVSGGNLYNRYFTEALCQIAEVQICSLADWNPAGDEDGIAVIDSIYLSKLSLKNIPPGKHQVLLLHYLDIFFDSKHDQLIVAQTIEVLRHFNYFMVTGQYVQDWLLAQGIEKEAIFLFEPVISTTHRKASTPFGNPLNVLMLGNLVPVKGYLDFFIELEAQQPAAIQVKVVGDASLNKGYASSIYRLIEASEYLSTTVVCLDGVEHNQVFDLFEECDLLLSASQFETFGIAVHEALAFQLPVAAISTGNLAHINHPNLFKYQTMYELVSCLQEQNRIQLTALPTGNEVTKPSVSWQQHAALFHSYFARLIQ